MSCKSLKLNGMLVTVDFPKAFDSANHQFLTLALKRYGSLKSSLNG